MKPVLFRSAFLLFLATIQVSFFNIVFASLPFPPSIALGAVVSLSLMKGFSFSWRWAIFGGMLFDAMLFSRIGGSSFEFVLASALFGMLSRELFLGLRSGRIFLFGAGMWCFEFVWRMTAVLWEAFHSNGSFYFLQSASFSGFFWSFIVSVSAFFLVFRLTSFFERSLEIFDRFRPHR